MKYYKTVDENGFVTVSTVDADGTGNSTKAEHDEVTALYLTAQSGYGVIETESGFAYAPFPVDPDPDLDDAEALSILLGGEGE